MSKHDTPLGEGDAAIYQLVNGKPCLVDVATGKKTEYASAEECWADIQKINKRR